MSKITNEIIEKEYIPFLVKDMKDLLVEVLENPNKKDLINFFIAFENKVKMKREKLLTFEIWKLRFVNYDKCKGYLYKNNYFEEEELQGLYKNETEVSDLNKNYDWCGAELTFNKIEWEFVDWAEKATNEAQIKGTDNKGNSFEATGIMGGGDIVEVYDIELSKPIEKGKCYNEDCFCCDNTNNCVKPSKVESCDIRILTRVDG